MGTHTKHGMSDTPQYHVWQQMVQRCNNPNNKRYHCYGGKGITVHGKWLEFKGFWEDNEKYYKKGLTIDRIDSSKGYEPSNVQWISHSKNSAKTNRLRSVKYFKLLGTTLTEGETFTSIREASRKTKTPIRTIENNLKTGRVNRRGYIWEYH